MNYSIKSTFEFKDEREYVHGTDIFNILLDQILENFNKNDKINIKLSFKKPIHSQCLIHTSINLPNVELSNNSSAELKLKCNESFFYYYIEEILEPIKKKYSSFEKLISDLAKVKNDTVTIPFRKETTFIENVVFMNKKLLSNKVNKNKKNFFFSLIEIHDLSKIHNINNISIKLDRVLGNKHFKSIIFVDSNNVGNIYFTLT